MEKGGKRRDGETAYLPPGGGVAKGSCEAVQPRASHNWEFSRSTPAGGTSGLPLLLELGGTLPARTDFHAWGGPVVLLEVEI